MRRVVHLLLTFCFAICIVTAFGIVIVGCVDESIAQPTSLQVAEDHFATCPWCSNQEKPICGQGLALLVRALEENPEAFRPNQ